MCSALANWLNAAKENRNMGHPGRPRRRNKPVVQPVYQPQIPQHYLKPIKEEPTSHLHDESDLISFRADATSRFVMNQENLENVTSKYIHASKIIPPKSFPEPLPKGDSNESDFVNFDPENVKHDQVYFGDLDALQKMKQHLQKELQIGDPEISFGEEYQYQQESTRKLAELTKNLQDVETLEIMEKEMNRIIQDYKQKFNKKYTSTSHSNPYKAEIQVKVDRAPENYNPKLLDLMVNLNHNEQNQNGHNTNPQNGQNGQNGQGNGNFNGEYFDNSFMEFQPAPTKDMMDQMVDDDMGGLIDFEGNDMMNGLDEDFLSQIDHSLE